MKRVRPRTAEACSTKAKAPEALNEALQISGREFLDSIRAIVEPLGGIAWFSAQESHDLYTTTIAQTEMQQFNSIEWFAGRVLLCDKGSACAFAIIAARHRRSGRTIVLSRGAHLAA